jgi:NADPH2:quinone reductase
MGGLDVVFDGVGGSIARSAFDLLEPGGRMLSFGLASGEWASIPEELAMQRGVQLLRLPRTSPDELRSLTATALREAALSRLKPVIGQRYPLERAGEAHAAMESRATIGKTLLEVGPPGELSSDA